MNMQQIDEGIKQAEIKARKEYLIKQLNKLGVYQSRDGRKTESLSIFSLERVHAEETQQ